MDAAAAAEALVRAGRRLGSRGLIAAGEGNLSVRLDADRLLITPAGRRKDELTADDLVVVWTRHAGRSPVRPTGRRPTLRPGHPPGGPSPRDRTSPPSSTRICRPSMALTIAGEIPDPAALPETALLLPRLPFVPLGAHRAAPSWPAGSRRR